MLKAALPANESERLQALRGYEILDTAPAEEFDDIVLLASRICGTPIAMISLVDENRQWFKSKIGTEVIETSRDIAFCAHGILQADVFVVEDATQDERFADNPLVTGESGVRFYAGARLLAKGGEALGMLCVNDRIPREITEEQKQSLQALSRQVVAQLELRRNVRDLRQMIIDRERTDAELAFERNLMCALMESSHDSIYFKDAESRFIRCSANMAQLFGVQDVSDLIGRRDSDFFSDEHSAQTLADELGIIQTGDPILGKIEKETWNDGAVTWVLTSKLPLRDKIGTVVGTIGISKDVTSIKAAQEELVRVHKNLLEEIAERKKSERERHTLEVELSQSHKLEAIGQLAAGIAHEINTPIQYVGDNTRFFKESFETVEKLLGHYEELLKAIPNESLTPDLIARANAARAMADLPYLLKQVPAAISETIDGLERISKIVKAMKEFSHPGGKEKTLADLNKAIESTVTVARNEWKYVAEVKLDLDPILPKIPCFLGEFNQSVLNLLINASHAIADVLKKQSGGKGLITLSTRRDGEFVEISVSDTGTGIPESARPHIFEPFFTTKEVGKGTGQGLSLVYSNIVKKHGGSVSFETETGRGTRFILRLPISASATSPLPEKL
jgi:PAS domain S-box-containing protein